MTRRMVSARATEDAERRQIMITHEDLIRYLTDDGYVFTYDESIEQEITEYENALRVDERRKVLEEAYSILADELMWVLHEYGDDVYLHVGDSVRSAFAKYEIEQEGEQT